MILKTMELEVKKCLSILFLKKDYDCENNESNSKKESL